MTIIKENYQQTIRDNLGHLISNVYMDKDDDGWFVSIESLDWYDDMYGDSHPFMDAYSYWYDTKEEAIKGFEYYCKYERLTYQWE